MMSSGFHFLSYVPKDCWGEYASRERYGLVWEDTPVSVDWRDCFAS